VYRDLRKPCCEWLRFCYDSNSKSGDDGGLAMHGMGHYSANFGKDPAVSIPFLQGSELFNSLFAFVFTHINYNSIVFEALPHI